MEQPGWVSAGGASPTPAPVAGVAHIRRSPAGRRRRARSRQTAPAAELLSLRGDRIAGAGAHCAHAFARGAASMSCASPSEVVTTQSGILYRRCLRVVSRSTSGCPGGKWSRSFCIAGRRSSLCARARSVSGLPLQTLWKVFPSAVHCDPHRINRDDGRPYTSRNMTATPPHLARLAYAAETEVDSDFMTSRRSVS